MSDAIVPLMSIETTVQQAIDALSLGSFYALIALGIALIFGIMRLINFAHGELIVVGAYALYFLSDPPWPLLIVVPIVVAAVFALLMERIAFRPVRNASPSTLLVTSFAVSYLIQNVAVVSIGAQPKGVALPTVFTEQVTVGDLRISKLSIITAVTAVVMAGGLAVFLRRTRLGLQMRAASEDFRMSRLLGVNANAVIMAAFVLSGILAGAVAILLTAQTGTVTPTVGLQPLLVGVVATVLGGMGSLVGATVGGLVLGGLTVGLDVGLPSDLRNFRDAFVFGAVILILLLRPQGLFVGQRSAARV